MDELVRDNRRTELAVLEHIFSGDDANVIGLYGIAGVGKSALLTSFVNLHSKECLFLDCQQIEPTPKAFIKKLALLGQFIKVNEEQEISFLLERIAPLVRNKVLVLDHFESFILMESWLRRTFVPYFSGGVRLIFAGRLHPSSQWVIESSQGLKYQCLQVDCLTSESSIQLLQLLGHSEQEAHAINQFAKGHPVALKLSSSALFEKPQRQFKVLPNSEINQTLVNYFFDDIEDEQTRHAIEALSIVRRLSQSLMAAMLELSELDDHRLYSKLGNIDFVESKEDGLKLHDFIKDVISNHLKSHLPKTYSELRKRACHELVEESKYATQSQMWRYTADLIYLVDNEVIRGAFYPKETQRDIYVDRAEPEDRDSIMEIIRFHEPPSFEVMFNKWWERYIHLFHTVKNNSNKIVGFYCLIKPHQISREELFNDPITRAWAEHYTSSRTNISDDVIFIWRWLSVNEGEGLSDVQAACWLDIKRTYLEMRPSLRYVYLGLTNLQPYAEVATELGFQVLDLAINLDDTPYYTACLDMGEGSVDQWISQRLIHEVQKESEKLHVPNWFDVEAKQIHIDDQRHDLTPLEFGTLSLLIENQNSAVSRKLLLKEVWGISYEGSSNVVDTIVRSLRKKLGKHARTVESVRGTGYRFAVR